MGAAQFQFLLTLLRQIRRKYPHVATQHAWANVAAIAKANGHTWPFKEKEL